MSSKHTVSIHEIGMIRIYLKPGERAVESPIKRFLHSKPLYRQLVEQAKAAGLMNAVAHQTHYGFSDHGRVQAEGFELANPELTMCVELIGDRAQLEDFCATHGRVLADKVIVYKHLEHWRVS
jgi:PII-like signaling protein